MNDDVPHTPCSVYSFLGVLKPQVFQPPDEFGKSLNLLTIFVCTLHRMKTLSAIHEKQTEMRGHTNKQRNIVNIHYPLINSIKSKKDKKCVSGQKCVFDKLWVYESGATRWTRYRYFGL